MAAELVNLATSDKLKEMDWIKNIEICELVARDQGEARDVMKAIKKRLGDKGSNTLLFTVMLLEVLINNCGEHIHRHVIEMGLLPILIKIVKKKLDQPVREKIFLLLDTTQASLGGASGKFPQYYAAYLELVNAGVQFPQTDHVHPSDLPTTMSQKDIPERKPISPKHEGIAHMSGSQVSPESSIVKKASAALDVLREVLDAIDTQHPEGAKDEFTLDLVEQCSFRKQRVMHLVLTCRDEKVVSQAIELNEQLEKVLARHDALISVRPASSSFHFDHEEAEEEDDHQLSRRIRKGKACARPEEEQMEKPLGLFGSIQQERLHRPIIRPVSSEPQESNTELPPPALVIPPQPHRPILLPVSSEPQITNTELPPSAVVIPPPPARRVERERFFQEKQVDVSADQTTTTSSLPSHKTDSSPS